MKTRYTIKRDDLVPPVKNGELALFTCALQSEVVRKNLVVLLGKEIPEQFEITHLTNPDDPPDIRALELGWECTEFPPDQSAHDKVHEERANLGMVVPEFSETRGDINEIRKRANLYAFPTFVTTDAVIAALEEVFLGKVMGKDIPGNDVLLLDHRCERRLEFTVSAIHRALQKKAPKYIKLIMLVAWEGNTLIPKVVQLHPNASGP